MKTIPVAKGYEAIVDDEDYEKLSSFKWIILKSKGTQYARCSVKISFGNSKYIVMHRMLIDVPPGMEIDHINHNGLDNRRNNLRIVTREQNTRNARRLDGKYKGVIRSGNRWVARIAVNGKTRKVAFLDTEEGAAMAYDKAALVIFGEYAHTNFNSSNYTQIELREMSEHINELINRVRLSSSSYKGVRWSKRDKRWLAYYKKKYLGRFLDELEAAKTVTDYESKLKEVAN